MLCKKSLFIICFILCFFAYLPPVQSQLTNPPENIELDPDVDSITITGNRVQEADHYKIYWGGTNSLSRLPIEVPDQEQQRPTHTISEFVSDTDYFFSLPVGVEVIGESSTSYNNKIGISGGYYLPFESRFEDFYGRDNYPVYLFYERILNSYVAVHLKAGYMRSSGNLRTVESEPVTGIDATFTMVPTSASINLRFPILPHVWGFAGIGPDYWYVRETFDPDTLDDTSEWIGGYHGRVGVWLYNMDIAYRRWGIMFETQYSVIDRFGQNDMDLGGWIFLIGGFYRF